MSVAFTLYLMCKVLVYMRIVYDASGMNVCMYVYSGVCTPRVGSRQASQNKLIWFSTTVLFVVKWRQNILWALWHKVVLKIFFTSCSLMH